MKTKINKPFCEHESLRLRYDYAFYCNNCKVTVISKELGAKALANADWAISMKAFPYEGQKEVA